MMHIYPAPAKINLHLRITRIRADGMHELDTAFAYVDLCDQIRMSMAENIKVDCSASHLSGEKNLVFQILAAFREKHGIRPGLHVYIDKHIPEQAGLGGGSSDAATALMAANCLWGVEADTDALIKFATPFGADIPCFIYGRASLARGIGEKMQDYPAPLPTMTLLLARPATGLSTRDVFCHFDKSHGFDRTLTVPEGLDTIRRDSPQLAENDLEISACSLNPDVAALLQCLRQHSQTAWMSGSGSACIALFEHQVRAHEVAELLKQQQVADWSHVGRMMRAHPMLEIE